MDKTLIQIEPRLDCETCGQAGARRYQTFAFTGHGNPRAEQEHILCVCCVRAERKRYQDESDNGISRRELIGLLDAFFESSGVFEICGRCHRQGTGCCPPSCRVMGRANGETGCDPNNHYGKTVFCSTFICGALLNAITECDPEIGRELRWVKRELGPAEFRIFEMITRAPAEVRETARPLALPDKYPAPIGLDHRIREKLLAMADEVLEIRRIWSAPRKK